MVTLTPDQLQDLREEFIEFKINEMTSEDMASYIRDIMIHDVNLLNKEELELSLIHIPSPRDRPLSRMPSSA